eukprot:TRINITY_DN3729_c3_g1_i2.p1 TRINITY_DN3729_c3_g1~~TRINITY_DN3729_c3_g1_i2.p1  ORF type:complete len:110 (+),score=33.07 TRINITY_DN3729_c3_g1_i2:110-439(+)
MSQEDQLERIWRSLKPKPSFNLVEQTRLFLKEGPIGFYDEKARLIKNYHIFCFNDYLLLCKPEQNSNNVTYRLKVLVTLQACVKVEDEKSGWSDFRASSPGSNVPDNIL